MITDAQFQPDAMSRSTVREVDEPRRLVFTWGDDELTFTPERPYLSDHWRTYYEEYKRRGLPATAEIPE